MNRNSYTDNLSDDLYLLSFGFTYPAYGDVFQAPHFGEDGGYEILTKGNKILLLFYIGDFDGPECTPLMRKTFTIPVKPVAKAKAKKTTTRKSPAKKGKAKTTKKTVGRKAPTLSATKRKVGTRMRGNDGKMWQVKKSGKSQRWMAGAETQTFRSSIDSKFDELL